MTEKANPKAKASPKAKANPKAKSAKKAAPRKEVDHERFLNRGIEVELSIGTFTFKELSAWDLTEVIASSFTVLSVLVEDTEGQSEYAALSKIVIDPQFKTTVNGILAKFTDTEDPDVFNDLKTRDIKVVIDSVKQVIDMEEIKELFFALNLQNHLPTTPTSTDK